MNRPFVSIIIPTYKDWQRLSVCIDSLVHQSYPQDCYEVIVVNNADDDIPDDFFLPLNCRVITELKPGSYAARNAGIKIAGGQLFGFTDSDCEPGTDWIENAVNYLFEHEYCRRIAGRVCLFYRSDQLSAAELYEKIYAFNQDINVSRDGIAVTANMFAYREVFEHIGVFNEEMMSGGDFEWSIRAKDAGYKIGYAKDSWVRHPARFHMDALIKKARRVGGGYEAPEEHSDNKVLSFFRFLYNLRPPLRSFKLVYQKGRNLRPGEKLTVISIR